MQTANSHANFSPASNIIEWKADQAVKKSNKALGASVWTQFVNIWPVCSDQDKLKIRKAVTQWFNNHSRPAITNDSSCLDGADAAAATAGISAKGTLVNEGSTVQNDRSLEGAAVATAGLISAEGTLAKEGSAVQNDCSLEGAAAATAGPISAEGTLANEGSTVQNEGFMNDWESATAVAASTTGGISMMGTLADGSASGNNVYTVERWNGEKVQVLVIQPSASDMVAKGSCKCSSCGALYKSKKSVESHWRIMHWNQFSMEYHGTRYKLTRGSVIPNAFICPCGEVAAIDQNNIYFHN
ncbi:hypothetical protein DFH29DRAFT_877973 [Suillus ampliporus]|nr:hypothetical protein DFH29DRAFT_877973 [Suillus ampliporus]